MLCIVSFIVLAILGLFSASHRKLAKEAFDCVLRRVTLRPCNTGFDTKIKSMILSGLITRSPKIAKFVSKRFELFSWVLMGLMLISLGFFIRGVVFFYLYGSCNGLNKSGFCVFDPSGSSNQLSGTNSVECRTTPPAESDLSIEGIDLNIFPNKNNNAGKNLLFVGCYSCEFTRKAYPMIRELLKTVNVNYYFAHFPTKPETKYLSVYTECVYQEDKEKLWEFNDKLFSSSVEVVDNKEKVEEMIADMGMDINKIRSCVLLDKTIKTVEKQQSVLENMGIYGTPTVFINGKPVVGPKPIRVYKRLLTGWLF